MADLEFSKSPQNVVIRQKAMDLLARREHSREELRRKLASRFPDDEGLVEVVMDKLGQEGLQSDQRFAESFLRSRVSKGQGPQRIVVELRQRGVSSSVIDRALQECEVDWFGLASQVLAKKYSLPAEDYSEKAKRSRFLQYRGFEMDQIHSALDQQSR